MTSLLWLGDKASEDNKNFATHFINKSTFRYETMKRQNVCSFREIVITSYELKKINLSTYRKPFFRIDLNHASQ